MMLAAQQPPLAYEKEVYLHTDIFSGMSKWFWAVAIAVSFVNAAIFWVRARKKIAENTELAPGYHKLIKGFVLWGNIPWIVMGVGSTLGGVPTVFHFFRPREGNPFVLAFFVAVVLLFVLGTYWLLFRDGAQMLVHHPGLFSYDFRTTREVKLFWFACLVGGLFGLAMMFTMDMPLPKYRSIR